MRTFLVLAGCAVTSIAHSVLTATILHPDGAISSEVVSVSQGRPVGNATFPPVNPNPQYVGGAWTSFTPGSWIRVEQTDVPLIVYGSFGDQIVGHKGGNSLNGAIWTGLPATANYFPEAHIYATDGVTQGGIYPHPITGYQVAAMWKGSPGSRVSLHPPDIGTTLALMSDVLCVDGPYQGGQVLFSYWNGASPTQAGYWKGTASSWVSLTPGENRTAWVRGISWPQLVGRDGNDAVIWYGTPSSRVKLNPPGSTIGEARAVHKGIQVGEVYFESSGLIPRASMWRGSPASYVDLHSSLPAGYDRSVATSVWTDGQGNVYIGGYAASASEPNIPKAIIWKDSVISLSATLNGAPAPAETSPSVYRLSNATGFAVQPFLNIFRIDITAPIYANKDVMAWTEVESPSGGHMHVGSPARPHGYLGDYRQIYDDGIPNIKTGSLYELATMTAVRERFLVSRNQTTPYQFCSGAFNNGVSNEPSVQYRPVQRSVPDTTPTNSYVNGVRIKLDAQGKGTIYYVASELAGIERVVVSELNSANSPKTRASIDFMLRYPGLVRINETPGVEHYQSAGMGPHLYKHTESGELLHYYATVDGKRAIEFLGSSYLADTGEPIKLNDASLPWGGMFDGSFTYNYPGHFGHRDGAEFDVSHPITNRKVERILREHPWWVISPPLWRGESDHFHIRLLPRLQWKGPSVQHYENIAWPKFGAFDPITRSRTVRMKFINRGVYRGRVEAPTLSATNGATAVWTVVPNFELSARQLSIDYEMRVSGIPPQGATVTVSGTARDITNGWTRPLETLTDAVDGVTQTNGIRITVGE